METKNNNILIIGIGTLVLGLVLGYFLGTGKMDCPMMSGSTDTSSHMMGGSHEMGNTMTNMTAGLEGKSGEEFEKAFIDEMIVHHEGAVDMAEILLQKTQRPELVKLGNDIISAQTNEIEMMKEWRQTWFNN
ncbi:DUF305 domain-containing protein [bacterium]|jgi:uncharacterized protein (DUF305 family)|nr:DUF305 domain-containing protein [bacterium]